MKKYQSGYIALMSVIIISAVFSILALERAVAGFFVRFGVLTDEQKIVSEASAFSCAHLGILSVLEDEEYAGGETVSLSEGSCEISQIDRTSAEAIFSTSAEFMKAYSAFTVRVDLADGSAIIYP